MQRRFEPWILFLVGCWGCSPAQLAPSKPVAPYTLEGTSLVHHVAGFAVSAPHENWTWEVLASKDPDFPELGGFSCDNPSGEEWILVSVTAGSMAELDDEAVSAFLGRPFDSSPDAVPDKNAERLRLGDFEAIRYRETERTPEGSVRSKTGYLVNAEHLVTISMWSDQPAEPAPLKRLASSIRRLR